MPPPSKNTPPAPGAAADHYIGAGGVAREMLVRVSFDGKETLQPYAVINPHAGGAPVTPPATVGAAPHRTPAPAASSATQPPRQHGASPDFVAKELEDLLGAGPGFLLATDHQRAELMWTWSDDEGNALVRVLSKTDLLNGLSELYNRIKNSERVSFGDVTLLRHPTAAVLVGLVDPGYRPALEETPAVLHLVDELVEDEEEDDPDYEPDPEEIQALQEGLDDGDEDAAGTAKGDELEAPAGADEETDPLLDP